MGDMEAAEDSAWKASELLLGALEVTKMTRSYKMLVLQAMLNTDTLPGSGIGIDGLAKEFVRLAGRSAKLRADVGVPLEDLPAVRRLLETNPINAWTGPASVPGEVLFAYESGNFRYLPVLADDIRGAFQQLVRELVEWRLAEYLARAGTEVRAATGFVMKVSHSGGRPILFLPDRARSPGIPEGLQSVLIDGKPYQANFVKVAVNVVRAADSDGNALPAILRGWFGPNAGLPGTDHRVACEATEDGLIFRPIGVRETDKPELFRRYSREQIPRLFGEEFNPAVWNVGFVPVPSTGSPKHLCLLATLHKGGMAQEFQYGDHFLTPDIFQWQSQNRTRQNSQHGSLIRDHVALGVTVHLFVRQEKKRGAMAAPFVYCGPVTFSDWSGDSPITVRWKLEPPLPDRIFRELASPSVG
jgi:hypothetical protein